MFDIAPTELLLVAFVALVVIGPKDLPKAMRVVGYWVGRARDVARQFRSGFDAMVREAELEEMEKKWAAENERIMREHPSTPAIDAPAAKPMPYSADHDDATTPVMVEKPHVVPAGSTAPGTSEGAAS
jgi:sec-independent protein translocase protein TatB